MAFGLSNLSGMDNDDYWQGSQGTVCFVMVCKLLGAKVLSANVLNTKTDIQIFRAIFRAKELLRSVGGLLATRFCLVC